MQAIAEIPPGRKRGGQPGNSNARKSGLHTAEIRAFTARVRNWKRRVRETLKFAEEKLALRRLLTSPNAGRSTRAARQAGGSLDEDGAKISAPKAPTRRRADARRRPPRKGEVRVTSSPPQPRASP